MGRKLSLAAILTAFVLLTARASFAASPPNFELVEIFDLDGDTLGPAAQGISRKGYIVGNYQDAADNFFEKGFLRFRRVRSADIIWIAPLSRTAGF
jgi:hypothetical protein